MCLLCYVSTMARIGYPKFGYPRVIPGPEPNFGYGLGWVCSLITRWRFSVSSICVIWVFPLYFTSVKKITESFVIFLRNGVLILNWKENKEAGAICFEIRIPSKKNKYLLRKVPSKIYGSYFIMEKNKNIFWFVDNSEYHHQEMGPILIFGMEFISK